MLFYCGRINLEMIHKSLGDCIGCSNDHLVNAPVSNGVSFSEFQFCVLPLPIGQAAKRSLMEVHDWVVVSLVAVNSWVGVQANNQIVSQLCYLNMKV